MANPVTRELQFSGSDDRPVRATLHAAEDDDAPLVIVAHGFKGFRNWGFFGPLCERLQAAGLNALRIDFSHNGVEITDFDRLDLFLIDTWTRHFEDLAAVVDGMQRPAVGLVGHSRGGGDALLYAAQDPRVKAVATLATLATTMRFPEDTEEQLHRLGYYPIENMRTKQIMPMARTHIDDSARHDIPAAVEQIRDRPLLVIHGTNDESVPLSDSRAVARIHGNAETLYLEGSGHTFECVHPFQGSTPAFDQLASKLAEFFQRTLSNR